jgi:energy-coupling factor transporter ATP-binding protein EcfA2
VGQRWAGDSLISDKLALQIRGLGFLYEPNRPPVLTDIDLEFVEGEFALICGPTGFGKSSLLKAINGLAPEHTGGFLSGSVRARDLSDDTWIETVGKRPSELARLLGYVNQNPERAFVAETVEQEIAFGMEQLGFEPTEMRARVEGISAQLGVTELLAREPGSLSSGQAQRVAIAAALAAGQRILLLDEPTSTLDDAGAAATIALLRSLASELGITILMVEHRVERVAHLVDSIVLMQPDGGAIKGRVELLDGFVEQVEPVEPVVPAEPTNLTNRQPLLEVENLVVKHDDTLAVDHASLQLNRGEILGLRGPNGAGKSSLLWAIQGAGSKQSGRVSVADNSPVTLVPQTAGDLLFLDSVEAELAESDRLNSAAPGATRSLLQSLVGEIDKRLHPHDLSAGQQLSLALAVQLVRGGSVLLLDEPTSALDYRAKNVLAKQLLMLRNASKGIIIASHDAEFLDAISDRVLTMHTGLLQAEEPTS